MPEDFKQSIEDFVASALKSRFEEGTASISRLREDLTQLAERLEEEIRAAGERPLSLPDDLFPEPAEPAATAETGSAMVTHIVRSQQDMLAATDQIGLLTQLLLSCTVSCPRVAFFIVRKEAIVGWAARGFEGAQDADLRSISMRQDENSILGEACRRSSTVLAEGGEYPADQTFLSRLGGAVPPECMAVPIFIRDKIVAVLYGDSGQEGSIPDPQLPEVLATHAGLCLETLATRLKYPRPKPGMTGTRPAAPAPAAAPAPGPAVPESASLSGVFQQPDFSQSGPQSVQSSGPQPAPQAAIGVDSGPQPAPAPAPPAGPDTASMSDADRKLHEEARRFARLLVSEIVLYNEKQAEEGRRNKDIYERLKDDIDRSLQMYEQRVDSNVRSTSNYFYEELVRTLANGDESAIKVPWA